MSSIHHPPSFGIWLKAQRTARGLTQARLAHEVGCATVTIKRIEADRLRPSAQLVHLLLKHLDIPDADHSALITLARDAENLNGVPTADTPEPQHIALRNPYKGLRAYTEADAADFFGRTALIARLVHRLTEADALARCLALVGPSGSGKSSAVHAGLFPILRQRMMPGSEHWMITEMRPGDRPLEELEAALLRVAVNPPETLLGQLREDERGLLRAVKRILPMDPRVDLLLVIDQFEELFSLVHDDALRLHLLHSLLATVTDPLSRMRLLIILRADFYDLALRYRPLAQLIQQRTEVVLPLTPHEIEEAIVGPATSAGLHLEPELVHTMVRDAGAHLNALPLLQYALTELCERREGHTLTHAAYHASGGVAGALSRRAEALYANLDQTHQETARRLFLRLITPGEGVQDTRRRARLSELNTAGVQTNNGGAPAPLQTVLERFSHYRLLTLDADPATREPTVELAHEALIANWERLRDWIVVSREEPHNQRMLTEAAQEWERQHAAMDAARREKVTRQGELEQVRALAHNQQHRISAQTHTIQRLRRRVLYLSIAVGLALMAVLIAAVLSILANTSAAEAAAILPGAAYGTILVTPHSQNEAPGRSVHPVLRKAVSDPSCCSPNALYKEGMWVCYNSGQTGDGKLHHRSQL